MVPNPQRQQRNASSMDSSFQHQEGEEVIVIVDEDNEGGYSKDCGGNSVNDTKIAQQQPPKHQHQPLSKLRILCLHDHNSNAQEFSDCLTSFSERLYEKHHIDLVYVNSPFLVPMATRMNKNTTTTTTKCRPSVSSATTCTRQQQQNTTAFNNNKGKESGDDRRKRIWWSESNSNSKPSSSSRHHTDDEKKVVTPCCPGPNKKEQERSQQKHQTAQIIQQQQQQQQQKIDSLGDTDDNDNGDFEWETVQEDNEDDANESLHNTCSAAQYIGLDTSLLMLKQMWTHDSFWGIFGVGQGATLGALLALLGTNNEFLSPPSFCIFVNGESVLDTDTTLPAQPSKKNVKAKKEEKETKYDEQQLLVDDLPCLHIIGTNESRPSSAGATTRLLQQFGGTAHYYNNENNHSPLLMKSTINAMGRFIITQKKKFKSLSQKQKTLVVLRKLVQQQEQEAALLIADTIAANPPRGLQALILPGGKMGGCNAGIGDDGGMLRKPNPAIGTRGAPCPSEFMLPQSKRKQEDTTTTTNLWGKETTKNEWYTYCQCTIEKPILQRHLEQLRQQRQQQHKKKQKEETEGEGRRGTTITTTEEGVGPNKPATPRTTQEKEEVLLVYQKQQQQQQKVGITNQNQGVNKTNTNTSTNTTTSTNNRKTNKNNPKTKTNNFDLLVPEAFGCCRLAPPSKST